MDNVLSLVLLLLKVTAVLLMALVVTVALARASAGSRHLVWLTALAGLLVLPAIAAWGPMPLRILPPELPAPTLDAPVAPGEATRVAGTQQAPSSAAIEPLIASLPEVRPGLSAWTILLAAWAIVAALLLAWLVAGAVQVHRIVKRARPLDDPTWQAPLYEIADRMGLEVAPGLVRSDDVMMPFAAGLLRPVIVLPEASDEWSAERRSAVLIHELAHVRRHDLVGHAIGRLACAVYWFHPLVWTGARRLRAESERACDDLALEYGTRPSEYAEHLLDIVSCVRDHRTPTVALALAHRKEFEGRMLAILNPDLARKGLGRTRSLLLAGSIAVLAVMVSAARPLARTAVAETAAADTAVDPVEEGAIAATDSAPVSPARRKNAVQPAARAAEPAAGLAAAPATALAAAPDSSDDERVALLANTLRTDKSAELRRIAAWGLEKYASETVASDALAAAVSGDSDADVREMAAWSLAEARGTPAVISALRKAAQDQDPRVRRTALWALGNIGNEATAEALATLLGDKDPANREMAAWGIGNSNPRHAPAALTALLDDPDPKVRKAVLYALYQIEDPATGNALARAFEKEKDPALRLRIVRTIGATGDDASVQVLQQLVSSEDLEVRKEAIKALAGAGGSGPWVWPRPQPRPFP